ncbi:hypothetical protein HDU76_011888, partial [Blyttiomyces sp. JEL0837]
MVQLLVDEAHYPISVRDLEVAAVEGHLELLQWLGERVDLVVHDAGQHMLSDYLSSRHIAVLHRWLHCQTRQMYAELASWSTGQNGFEDSNRAEPARTRAFQLIRERNPGVQSIIQFSFDGFRNYFKIVPEDIDKYPHMDSCARWGWLDYIKYLHDNGGIATTDAMDDAAEFGRLSIVKFLHNPRKEGCTVKAMNKAASQGYLSVVKFIHYNRSEGCTINAMEEAASKGHLETVCWLHENRTEGCTTRAMDGAAENGFMRVVKFLIDNRTEGCTVKGIEAAAINKQFKIAKLLMKKYPGLKKKGM